MKTYIINLERSPERKVYMKNILKNFPTLDFEFIAAVDGKAMSKEEQNKRFNKKKFFYRYNRDIRPGEIGCTLSHQKCYKKIVEDKEPCVLILEDDIIQPNDIYRILQLIEKKIQTEVPQIILLSGWYWYYHKKHLIKDYNLTKVYDALLTHAYVINQAAAKILIEERPYITADDWRYIRKRGIKLQAIQPHLIDQNQNDFKTTIQPIHKSSVSITWKLKHLHYLCIRKLLYITGYFEKESFTTPKT